MKLALDKVEIKGFRSFITRNLLHLSDRGTGLHFMRGQNLRTKRLTANGSGKSSFWQAIVWCWYGKTSDGLRNPDIEPWYGPSNKTIVRTFIRRNGKPSVIERQTYPNRLLIDDKQASQEDVEYLLRMSFATCTNSIIIGQGKSGQSLFLDLPPRLKMERFSDVLPLGRWEKRAKYADSQTEIIDERLTRIATSINAKEAQLKVVTKQLNAVQADSDRWERGTQKNLDQQAKEISALRKQVESLHNRWSVADLAFDGASTELRHYQRELQQLRQTLSDVTTEIAAEESYIEAKRHQLLLSKKHKTCPTCGQPMKNALSKEAITDLEEIIRVGVPSALLSARDDVLEQIREAIRNERIFQDKANAAHDDLDSLTPQVAKASAQLKQLTLSNTKDVRTQNPFDEQLTNLTLAGKSLRANIDDLEHERKLAMRNHARTKFWIKGFLEVRLQVIEEVLEELELTTNAMLDDVGLVDWQVRYDIEKESKTGNISHGIHAFILSPDNKKAVRWECFSGGESQRLRLVGTFAFSEVLLNHAGVQSQLEALDEPTQHIAAEGIQDLCEFLSERAHSQRKQIWLIDHHAIDSRLVDSTVMVTKRKSGSEIEA